MSIIPKSKKDLRNLTVLDREREIKKLRGETEELIDEMGHGSEKRAARTVQEYVKEQDRERKKQYEIDEGKLKLLSTHKVRYQRYLIAILHRFVQEEDPPKKYPLYVESTDEGIVLGIEGTDFIGAFKVCGIPFYDINACKILAVQLGNTIGKLEGYVHKTEGGIIIPDKLDLKTITKKNA
jgi:hypothetical protein